MDRERGRCQKAAPTRPENHEPHATLPNAVGIALAVCVLTGLAVALESRAQQPVIRCVRDHDAAPELKAKDLDGRELSSN